MIDTNDNAVYDGLPATEQEHATPNHADAYIHTSEFMIPAREGIDLNRDLGSKKRPKIITSWQIHTNANGKSVVGRFNPNFPDTCLTLGDFETRLTEWAEGNGFNRSDVFINRADVSLDVYDQIDAPRFKKLADLLVIAFVARRNVSLKNQYSGRSILHWIEKNTKATADRFEIEIYRKGIQNPRHGAIWRLELRDWRDLRQQPKNTPEYLHDLLSDIKDELSALADCYDAAIDALAKAHRDMFAQLQTQTNGALSKNQFVLQHDAHVFNRAQIRQFFELVGDEHAAKNAMNYCDRYAHEFVSRKEFIAFIDDLKHSISLYLSKMDTSK